MKTGIVTFFNVSISSREEFSKNKIAILTYNYDRSLEHFLIKGLRETYNLNESELKEFISSIPIIHLHGSLGHLPPLDQKARPYQEKINYQAIETSMHGIKIIREEDVEKIYEDAYQFLKNAERICFLGFGYNEVNLKRLFGANWSKNRKWIGGTAVGLTEMEIRNVLQAYDYLEFQIDSIGWTTLKFLRETGVLKNENTPHIKHKVEKDFPLEIKLSPKAFPRKRIHGDT